MLLFLKITPQKITPCPNKLRSPHQPQETYSECCCWCTLRTPGLQKKETTETAMIATTLGLIRESLDPGHPITYI